MEKPPMEILTERLRLRAAVSNDAKPFFVNYTSDKDASLYLQRLPHQSLSETEDFVKTWSSDSWESGSNRFAWVICERGDNIAVGLFLLLLTETVAEIHFGIAPRFWRQGLITEAGKGVMNWVKGSAIEAVSTVCDCENVASMSVLVKLGFTRLSLLPGHLFLPAFGEKRDCWVYGWERQKS